MITAPSLGQDIAGFAALVRARLGDLAADEVEDLTDGLESDLAEKAEDEDLGDAEAYADELRSAAGIPPRSSRALSLTDRIHRARARVVRGIRSHPTASSALDFLVSIRPVWWVLRALLGVFLLSLRFDPIKSSPIGWTVSFVVLLVISVQWGRGRWMPQRWLRGVRLAANILAIIVAPFALGAVIHQAAVTTYADPSAVATPAGLTRDGGAVTNIFAYDSDGNPLIGVQLFDENGKPLSAKPNGESYITQNDATALIANAGAPSGNGWNVFPLESVPLSAFDAGTDKPNSSVTPSAVAPPFAHVQPLITPVPTATAATAQTGPTSAPSSPPAPSPSTTP